MIPEQITERVLVKLCDTHPILIRLRMFRHDVHCQLCQIQVCSNPGSSSDPGRIQDLPDHGLCKVMCGHLIMGEVGSHIDKHLIYTVYHDILRSHKLQVDPIDLAGQFLIILHPRRGDQIAYF